MKAIQATTQRGEFVNFHYTDAEPVYPELHGIAPEQVADKFCFEVGGMDRRSIAFFGFIIQSNLSFQVLKKRNFDEFKKTNTFMWQIRLWS